MSREQWAVSRRMKTLAGETAALLPQRAESLWLSGRHNEFILAARNEALGKAKPFRTVRRQSRKATADLVLLLTAFCLLPSTVIVPFHSLVPNSRRLAAPRPLPYRNH